VYARSEVLDDRTCATGDGQDVGYLKFMMLVVQKICKACLQDDVLASSPAGERTGQSNSNHLRALQFPGQSGHDVDCIRSTHSDANASESSYKLRKSDDMTPYGSSKPNLTSIRGVRVSSYEQQSGEGVILEHDLMDNSTARVPEACSILVAGRREEFEDFLVDVL